MGSTPVNAISHVAGTPAVSGTNDTGNAVVGTSKAGYGVWGENDAGVAVGGGSKDGIGVYGITQNSTGVGGSSIKGYGVQGISTESAGVEGDSDSGCGVVGTTKTADGKVAGVRGWDMTADPNNSGGLGVRGDSNSGTGVAGFSTTFRGVYGSSQSNAGVVGESENFDGVFGISHKQTAAGVSGHNPGGMAGYFEGNVVVTGNVVVNGDITLTGADLAEQFELTSGAVPEPGTVMVTDDEGRLTPSMAPYDHRVVGVVSGAGEYKPAIVLDGQAGARRAVIGLMGKVCCKVDASIAPIRAGDLLTTSSCPGHAMKATECDRSLGAVIGKALRPVESGRTIIPVLVFLR